MTRGSRRRRALILLSLALASGGLAASQVSGTVQRVEARVGRPVPVVVARRELAANSRLDSGGAARRGAGSGLPKGERAVEVAVAGGAALSDGGGPGTRVDVVVSTEHRTFIALEDVELLSVRPGGGGGDSGGARSAADAVATLRVTLRQAVYLTAAENFAREVRLLPRPPGDRRHGGGAAFGSGDL